jgi:ABC-2 type transport system ATP-binding protein
MADGEMVAVDTIDNLREEIGAGAVVEATVDAVPDLDPVRSIEGVREVSAADDVVRVSCSAPEAKMPALRRLDDAGTVRDIDVEDTSLESLFEQYTNGGATEATESAGDASGTTASTDDAAAATAGGEN